MFNEQSSFFGPVSGSPAQAVAFILSRPHGEYSDKDIIETIVPAYFEVCVPVGIDPILAIAQMAHETGTLTSFWSQRGTPGESPRRNPAGIGVTGERAQVMPADTQGWAFNTQRQAWEKGCGFASWKNDSIPAHIGRLVAWTTNLADRTEVQRELVARALAYRPLPLSLHGSAPVLRQLGKVHNPTNQGWASPGDLYGDRIASIARAILGI